MKKCTKCGRPLTDGEKDLCPACASDNNYDSKQWIEIISVTLSVIGAGVLWVLSAKK